MRACALLSMCWGGRAGSPCWWWGDTVTCVRRKGRRLSDGGEFRAGGEKCEAAPVSLLPLRSLFLLYQLRQICLLCPVPFSPWISHGLKKNKLFFTPLLCVSFCSHASGTGHPEWQHKLDDCQWPGPHLPQRHHGEPGGKRKRWKLQTEKCSIYCLFSFWFLVCVCEKCAMKNIQQF